MSVVIIMRGTIKSPLTLILFSQLSVIFFTFRSSVTDHASEMGVCPCRNVAMLGAMRVGRSMAFQKQLGSQGRPGQIIQVSLGSGLPIL